MCRRLAGNDADGLDATQEALIAIVKGLPRFGGRASFSTWAYRVATNAALDELRRRARRPLVGLPENPGLYQPVGAGGTSRSADPSESVTNRIQVDAALAALPEIFRAPVVLRDVAGLNYTEIAEVLQIPLGTVRSRIARGRARLALLLKGREKTAAGRDRSPAAPEPGNHSAADQRQNNRS